MAEFNMTLTAKGAELLAKCIAGQELRFSAVCMGDGMTSTPFADMTALVSLKNRLSISKISRKDTAATLRAILSFADIAEGYHWRELGLYAGDVETGAEVLYAYGNAGDKSDWIPAGGATTLDEKKINVTAVTASAANVTAVIDGSLIYATQDDLDRKADRDLGNVDAEVFAQLVAAAESNIDCGLFDELAAVAAHDGTPDAHAAMLVDGNAAAPVGTAETLEEHMIDPAAHQNIVLDGNQ